MYAIRTLGTLDVRSADGTSVQSIVAQPKRLALLCYLAAARPNGWHARDRLVALFWPELDDEHARNALSQAVHFLRRSLGSNAILSRGDDLALNFEHVECDKVAFERCIEGEALEGALAIYQGDFLDGFFISDAPDFEHWLYQERNRLRERAAEAAAELARRREAAEDLPGAVEYARRCTTLAPYDEQHARRLLTLLHTSRQSSQALAWYNTFADRLWRDLELKTSPELRAVVAQIRASAEHADPAVELLPPQTPTAQPPHSAGLLATAIGPADGKPAAGLVELPSGSAVSAEAHEYSRTASRRVKAFLVSTLVIVATVLGSWLALWHQSADPSATDTTAAKAHGVRLAVLPFVNLSGDPSQEYFSDGMSEELLTALADVPGLFVPGRTSSFSFKGRNEDVRRIADALGVDYILEGNFRRTESRVNVTGRLVDARNGYQIWARSYDREIGDVIDIQQEIARSIVAALGVKLLSGENLAAVMGGTNNQQAYEAFLQGRAALSRLTVAGVRAATEHFTRAVSHDTNFARAYSGLAAARYYQSELERTPTFATEAQRMAERALEIQPLLGEPHAVLGMVATSRFEWDAAGAHFKSAVHNEPGTGVIHAWYSAYLRATGSRQEAIAEGESAATLDPLSSYHQSVLAIALLRAGDLDRAIHVARRGSTLDSMAFQPHYLAGIAHLYSKRYEESIPLLERAADVYGLAIDGIPEVVRGIGASQGVGAYAPSARERALQIVQRWERSEGDILFSAPFFLATWYMLLGNTDEMYRVLESAVNSGTAGILTEVRADAVFDRFHGEPRFGRLLRRMNLQPVVQEANAGNLSR